MFIDYYTGQYRPKKEIEAPAKPEEQPGSAVSNLTALIPLPYVNVGGGHKSRPSEPEVSTEDKTAETPVEYDIPKPRTAFSSFVDHPQEFIRFLEALIQQEDLKKEDKIDLYTTLFEMYLDTANGKKDNTEKQEWQDRAKKLIEGKDVRTKKTISGCMANPRRQIPISTSNVLLLSDLANFRQGTTLVREQEGLRADIFRSYTAAKDTQGVIRALRKYGPQEPQLYIDALAYFASSPKILEEAGDELDVVLRKIDEDGLMAPLQVIQSLSNNAVVTMGMVKRYLSSNIERERKEITTVSLTLSSSIIFCL